MPTPSPLPSRVLVPEVAHRGWLRVALPEAERLALIELAERNFRDLRREAVRLLISALEHEAPDLIAKYRTAEDAREVGAS